MSRAALPPILLVDTLQQMCNMVKDAGNFTAPWMRPKQISNTDEKLDTKKLYQLYNDVLQPLSLFSNQTDQTIPEKKDTSQEQKYFIEKKDNLKENVEHNICNDEVYGPSIAPFMKDVCTVSADVLCEIIRRRLHQISTANVVSTEVQRIFGDVILGEVNVALANLPDVLCVGLLTPNQKRRLHKRLITHIMIVSEELFLYYLHKMEQNKLQSVFSEEANLTRFKAQLLLDCSKFMNVFSVKNNLITEIKELEDKQFSSIDNNEAFYVHKYANKKKDQYKKCRVNFTMEYFIRMGRPEITGHQEKRETDLMQLGNIKRLDLKKVHMLIPRQEDRFIKTIQCEAITTPCPFLHEVVHETKLSSSPKRLTSLKKSVSCPNLRTGDLLADELRITFKQCAAECPENIDTAEAVEVNGDPIKDDLRRLIEDSVSQTSYQSLSSCTEEEIPPLIRAIAPGNTNAARRQKMEALLQDLNEGPKQRKETKTEKSLHPQPFTIDVQISDKPLVRKADVQASDRILTHLTEIPKYPPLYNDFASEIEATTVQKLDRNLYVGQELQEVYTELTKNISTDHLRFDQDLDFELYATKVDISTCAASSTLAKKTRQRVINKELDSLGSSDKCESMVQHVPTDKDASRICNSWLVWWKSIVNTDDYIKYISTQDLDYLKVIYHLYNSDSEDEEQANIAAKFRKEEQKRQREKKIADLREQKQCYIPGMWNVNSVMLGGLGSEPRLQDVECEMKDSIDIPHEAEPTPCHEDLQKKIHGVWSALHVPESHRLDMAIKYSSNEYRDRLQEALKMWEKAITLIKRREKILAKLEIFERAASDPNRFFHRGYEGTSMARMEESRKRKKLNKQMEEIEPEIYKILYLIKKKFNDTVSYKGRPYSAKMKWDKTEMLYWLQQERRKTLMEVNLKKENTCVKLEPIN